MMGEYDALLGCPLILPSKESAQSVELRDRPVLIRVALCTSFFHAVNWTRQLLNSFSKEQSEEVRGKCPFVLLIVSLRHSNTNRHYFRPYIVSLRQQRRSIYTRLATFR